MGHEVFIFAPRWPGYVDKNKNVFRYPAWDIKIKIRFPIAIPYSRNVDKILENLDLDIIHSQHPNLLGSAARRWARKKNIPLVFTWHTLYDHYAHFVPFISPRMVAWWTIRNARRYANRSDLVIAPTDSIIPILRSWGVKKDIRAIPTGVEEDIFRGSDREKSRKRLGISGEDRVFLLVSRLTKEKNVRFIFDSLEEVLNRNCQTKLLVVGGGDLLSGIEVWARKNKLEKKIIFAGEIDREAVKDYYAASDIFVYASLSETQGMIVTEAMYMGLPILAVRATGISSLVEEGKNGFLVAKNKEDFREKAEKLLDDDGLRKKMGEESGRIAREKYTSDICAKEMIEVYWRLTNKGK
jgi:glycosyltransferase involved in cell wall biosynthesis